MHELAVLHGSFPILNGKLWAVVKAFQTQRAFLFGPDRVSVLARYGLLRTLAGAQPATYALVLHDVEMLCPALILVGEIIPASQPMGKTQMVEVASLTIHDSLHCESNALFCFSRFSQTFLVVRHVKDRSPYVHHSYVVFRIKPPAFVFQ